MPVQTPTISIKQIDDYHSTQPLSSILWGFCLLIESPFDRQLVDSIKSNFHWMQREWTGSYWAILKDNPNFQIGQESNLEILRRIAQDCAKRRGWLLTDYTAQDENELNKIQEQRRADLLENHVAAMLEVLPKLPPNSIQLVHWRVSTMSLQFTHFIGEHEGGYDLFRQWSEACLRTWKPFDHQPYRYEVLQDPRIIKSLLKYQEQYFLNLCQLSPVHIFDNHTAHFVDEHGQAWIGIDISAVKLAKDIYMPNRWNVAILDETIYWVIHRDSYVSLFVEYKFHHTLNTDILGAGFAELIRTKHLPEMVNLLNMKAWFVDWVASLFDLEDENTVYLRDGFRQWDGSSVVSATWESRAWEHRADSLITHLLQLHRTEGWAEAWEKLFGVALPVDWLLEVKAQIEQLKVAAGAEAREKAKVNAQEVTHWLLQTRSKDGLIKIAEAVASKFGVVVRKSWKRDEILDVMVSNREFCEHFVSDFRNILVPSTRPTSTTATT